GHLMLVAGGIGQTPFLAVAREALGLRRYGSPPRDVRERPARVSLCYGVRNVDYLAGLDDFQMDGLDVRIATDDGSHGHHGFVTDVLAESLDGDGPPTAVYSCGPEGMMHAVARLCAARNVPCWLSLETPMACGFGACFSCVTRVRQEDGSWDYRRTCVEGPVFEAERLVL
ncbi:MAG: dihydroorotate dehydrogenase electron transfer subunit, partial [Planctomycetaceae bacterium]